MPPVNPRYRVRYANGDVHEIQADSIGDVLEASRIIREREACNCLGEQSILGQGEHASWCLTKEPTNPETEYNRQQFLFIASIRLITTVSIGNVRRDVIAE